MANLPATTTQSALLEPSNRFIQAIAEHISHGKRPAEIARLMYPEDRVKRRSLRLRIWRMLETDDRLATELGAHAKVEMLLALVPATRALGQRAARGRPDAAKLLFEATGFHNPRVKHDHSGEIKIKLEIPRPAFESDVVDADVVDDGP